MQVGVPIHVAKILTYPERVHPANRERLQKLVMNGPDVHPGANFITKQGSNDNISLRYDKKKQFAGELKVD